MPRRKVAPSLFESSALATCQLVRDAVSSEARLSWQEACPKNEVNISVLNEKKIAQEQAVIARRIDGKCAAIAHYLKSELSEALLSDLANVYVPKLCDIGEAWSDFKNNPAKYVDGQFEAVYAFCAFLKCGLREVSFSEVLTVGGGGFHPSWKYSKQATILVLLGIIVSPDFFINLKRLDLRALNDVIDRDLAQDKVIPAIAEHGKELVHLNLGSIHLHPRPSTCDSTFAHFIPEKNERGAFVGTVPCPKLASFVYYHSPAEVETRTIVDFLLSHPLLSSFHRRIEFGEALNMLGWTISQMQNVFGEWKSNLTQVDVVMDYERAENDGYPLVQDSVSKLAKFFPKVVVLKASLSDSDLLELIPWMQRLQHLDLELEYTESLGSNAVVLLTGHGRNLTTLGIACYTLAISQLEAIDQGCPKLAHLSLQCVKLTAGGSSGILDFGLFRNLEDVTLRLIPLIGSGDEVHPWSLSNALWILLKNKPLLERFTLLTSRNKVVTDDFVSKWVTGGWTPELRKVTFHLSLGKFLKWREPYLLTDAALANLATLPKISEIGDLEFWSMDEATILARANTLQAAKVNVKLIRRCRVV